MSSTQPWAVGTEVRLLTCSGEEVSGTVFAYDTAAEMLMLREKGAHNGVSTLRLLAVAQVAETLSERHPTGPVELELPVVDEERCRRREEKALKLAEQDYDRVGVGVSKEAQAIFEALSKTLPCKWRKKTIVVLDEVLVPEPYLPSSCSADGGRVLTNPKALDRVQLIVRDARVRLGLPIE